MARRADRPAPAPAAGTAAPGALPPRLLLADADAFFVAVARKADPGGAGRAALLIVGGAPGSRGVVCSASYEARRYGVRSAMPIARALRLCPDALCVPVPRAACTRESRAIAAVLRRFAPLVEAASIDEWYLDLSGTEALYAHAPLAAVAHRIREAVRAETGMALSIGGGTNRLVAKLAAERAKPRDGSGADGVHVVAAGDEGAFLREFAVGDLPMVGPRLRERLEAVGLARVRDVVDAGPAALVRLLGERAGTWLYERACGRAGHAVVPDRPARSVGHETTFDADVRDPAVLEQRLVALVTRAASDLRARGRAARTVTVKVKDADFTARSAATTLPDAVLADRVLLATARTLLDKLRRARPVPARLLGVTLSGLCDADGADQLPLFDAPLPGGREETTRDRALATAVDALRARFGADAVLPARLAPRPGVSEAPAAEGRRPARAPAARRSGRSGSGSPPRGSAT